jgi:vacuolar-type H+-ATPase subunit C/Vma6
VMAEGIALTDLTYGVVKASARKSRLLSDQQIIDLANSRDLKDLQNKLKDMYPSLGDVTPSLRAIEESLLGSYTDEVDEFVKAAPDLAPIFSMLRREVDELGASEALKIHLGIIAPDSVEGQRKLSREEVIAQYASRGFATEVKRAIELYETYKVPGLIDAIFARQRILNIAGANKGVPKGVLKDLKEYSNLKVDMFNIDILIRGIKNGIDKKALQEILIYNGSIPRKLLLDASMQTDIKKALALIESAGLPKMESPRALERYYETKTPELMHRIFYGNYLGAGAIMGYLELKLREIRNIIRVANSVSLGIDPKRVAQEFMY